MCCIHVRTSCLNEFCDNTVKVAVLVFFPSTYDQAVRYIVQDRARTANREFLRHGKSHL